MALYPGKFQQVMVILSTGRTGTMGLARLFDAGFENVKGLHEPKPSRNLRIASNKAICGKLTRDQLYRKLRRSRQKLLARINEPIYVESNWYLYGFVDVLRDVYGPVKVLHVVRDPRTLIRSYLNFGTFRGLKGIASTYFPYWTLKTHQYKSTPLDWSAMSETERLAWIWKTINGEIQLAEKTYGDDYLRVRYEDLFSNNATTLRSVVEWMNLSWREELSALMHTEKTNASRRDTLPKFEQWRPDEQQRVLDHCGDMMRLYGYTSGNEGNAPQLVNAAST